MTFDITGASWNWTQSDGSSGAIVEPPNVLLAEPEFLDSGGPDLSAPPPPPPRPPRATLDFDDNDLEVARHVQRSTRSLDQQCAALARLAGVLGATSALEHHPRAGARPR